MINSPTQRLFFPFWPINLLVALARRRSHPGEVELLQCFFFCSFFFFFPLLLFPTASPSLSLAALFLPPGKPYPNVLLQNSPFLSPPLFLSLSFLTTASKTRVCPALPPSGLYLTNDHLIDYIGPNKGGIALTERLLYLILTYSG